MLRDAIYTARLIESGADALTASVVHAVHGAVRADTFCRWSSMILDVEAPDGVLGVVFLDGVRPVADRVVVMHPTLLPTLRRQGNVAPKYVDDGRLARFLVRVTGTTVEVLS